MTRHERDVVREMFPKCYFCAGSLLNVPDKDLVEVTDRPNRLAHRDCLAYEADDGTP